MCYVINYIIKKIKMFIFYSISILITFYILCLTNNLKCRTLLTLIGYTNIINYTF